MAAQNTDLVRNAAPNFATTLNGSISPSAATIVLQSITNLSTGTAVTVVLDATDANGNSTPTLKEVVTGVVNTGSSSLVNCLRGLDGTTAQSHGTGANVVMWVTANLWNDFQTSYLTQHAQLGAHVGLTNTGGMTTDNVTYTGTFTGVNGTIKSAYLTNPYKFFVYRNAAYTSTNSTSTPIPFDTAVFDTGSNVDLSTHKGRFTAPIAGFYRFSTNLMWTVPATSGIAVSAGFLKNGAQFINGPIRVVNYTGSFAEGVALSAPIQLSANDYVEVCDPSASGLPMVVGSAAYSTWFEGELRSFT